MTNLITMQQAIIILGVSQVRFYKLRNAGQIPDGTQKERGKRKFWSKKAILACKDKINKDTPKSIATNFDLVLSTLQKTSASN